MIDVPGGVAGALRGQSCSRDQHPGLSSRILALDGVRGVAVLLVTMLHLLYSEKSWMLRHVAGSGWIGVDLFFVLSAFLITGILLATVDAPNFFSSFYARRALRIWPLYYLLLAFTFIGARALPSQLHVSPVLAAYYVTFTQNIFLPRDFGPWALAGTWSLAIEEQFYLVWPWCVRRLSQTILQKILLGIVIVLPFVRCVALVGGMSPRAVYISSFMRVDDLAAGALAAIFFASESRPRARAFCRTLGTIALCAGVSLSMTVAGHRAITGLGRVPFHEAFVLSATYSLLAVGFASVVVLAASEPFGFWARALQCRPLQFFGRISFGVYLIQGTVVPLAQAFLRPWLGAHSSQASSGIVTILVGAFAGVTTVVLALASWRLIELPALTLARRFVAVKASSASD